MQEAVDFPSSSRGSPLSAEKRRLPSDVVALKVHNNEERVVFLCHYTETSFFADCNRLSEDLSVCVCVVCFGVGCFGCFGGVGGGGRPL